MTRPVLINLLAITLLVGCHHRSEVVLDPSSPSLPPHELQIENPDVCLDHQASSDLLDTPPPPTVREPQELERWHLSLEQVIQMALTNSEVIRDLGGLVVSAPQAARTVYDPAIQETSLLNGSQAALSAFDAQFATSLYFNRDERTFNNVFFGGGAASTAANFTNYRSEVTKIAPTGTRFAMRQIIDYRDDNVGLFPNGPKRFWNAFDGYLQGEFRHPLSYSADYFRIAGTSGIPGQYNGVLIARINTDIQLADFEAGVRDMLRDAESLYWELYFAYRDLDAKVTGRASTLGTWRLENQRYQGKIVSLDKEALARQQFFLAQQAIENAVSGTPQVRGVLTVEGQLRRLLGLPANDGRIIVPATPPVMADVQFDWTESLAQAMIRRVELRRQQWTIKQRELELIASRNLARMKVDFVGQYTWRGFGDDLLGDGGSNASYYQDLFSGDLQGWQFGLEVSSPVGNRIGHLAVRNAELRLMRDRALIAAQQEQIVSELREAFVEVARAYSVSKTTYNRYRATLDQLKPILERHEVGTERTDFVLDAQQRVTESESQFHRAVVDYNLALSNLHYVRGTLLDYLQVNLSEGPWTDEAHQSAVRMARRLAYKNFNYCVEDSYLVSQGEYPQQVEPIHPPMMEGGLQIPSEEVPQPAPGQTP